MWAYLWVWSGMWQWLRKGRAPTTIVGALVGCVGKRGFASGGLEIKLVSGGLKLGYSVSLMCLVSEWSVLV
jgi:hypothetical protein